jgi:hypothetical protein
MIQHPSHAAVLFAEVERNGPRNMQIEMSNQAAEIGSDRIYSLHMPPTVVFLKMPPGKVLQAPGFLTMR